jgi:hypothetical protein
LADRDISGLGEVCLKAIRTTKTSNGEPPRVHGLYTVQRNGFNHAVEVTPPASGKPKYVIVSHGGWGMAIEGGISININDALANQFPDATIVAKSPDGIGQNGDSYTSKEENLHGLKAQGIATLAIAKAFAGDRKVISAGLSMGSVIQHHAAYENFFGKPENGPINLAALLEISPARVDPSQRHDMVVTFLPQVAWHVTKQFFKTAPVNSLKLMNAARNHGWSRESRLAFSHQLSELLLCGTPEEEVGEVTSAVKTTAVLGELDILAQKEMRERIEAKYSGQMHNKWVPKRGHDIAGQAEKCALAVRKAVDLHLTPKDLKLGVPLSKVPKAA